MQILLDYCTLISAVATMIFVFLEVSAKSSSQLKLQKIWAAGVACFFGLLGFINQRNDERIVEQRHFQNLGMHFSNLALNAENNILGKQNRRLVSIVDKKIDTANTSIDRARGIISLVNQTTQRVFALSRKLDTISGKIDNTTTNLINFETGGDNIVDLLLSVPFDDKNPKIGFTILSTGDYSLRNVNIKIYYKEQIVSLSRPIFDTIINHLNKNDEVVLRDVVYTDPKRKLNLKILIITDSKEFYKEINAAYSNGRWGANHTLWEITVNKKEMLYQGLSGDDVFEWLRNRQNLNDDFYRYPYDNHT